MLFRMVLPPNAHPGFKFRVSVYDGTEGTIVLPPGYGPGEVLHFELDVEDEEKIYDLAERVGDYVRPKTTTTTAEEEERKKRTGTGTGTGTQCGREGGERCSSSSRPVTRYVLRTGRRLGLVRKFEHDDPVGGASSLGTVLPVVAVLLQLVLIAAVIVALGATLAVGGGPYDDAWIVTPDDPFHTDADAASAFANAGDNNAHIGRIVGRIVLQVSALCLVGFSACVYVESLLYRFAKWKHRDRRRNENGGGRDEQAAATASSTSSTKRIIPVATHIKKTYRWRCERGRHLPRVHCLSGHVPPELVGAVSSFLNVGDVRSLIVTTTANANAERDDVAGRIRRAYLRHNFTYLADLWKAQTRAGRVVGIRAWMAVNDDWKTMYTSKQYRPKSWDYAEYRVQEGGAKAEAKASGRLSLDTFDQYTFDCIFDCLKGTVAFGLTDVTAHLIEDRGASVNELYPAYKSGTTANVNDAEAAAANHRQRRPPLFFALMDNHVPPSSGHHQGDGGGQGQGRGPSSPLEYMLAHPAVDVNWEWTNVQGHYWNLFQFAACSGQVSVDNFRLLLRHENINVNDQPSPCGRSALHDACIHVQTVGSVDKVRLLLGAGADPNLRDINGRTPWKRMVEQWELLKKEDVSVGTRDEIVALLVGAGAIDPAESAE